MNASEHLGAEKLSVQGKSQIKVLDAWVRLTPPVIKNTAAYFVILNSGLTDIKVTGMSSVAARTTMMHDSIVTNGVASMVHLEEVNIPAGQTLEFKPGGKHLMLMGLSDKLVKGKKIPVVFHLQNGDSLAVDVPVK